MYFKYFKYTSVITKSEHNVTKIIKVICVDK